MDLPRTAATVPGMSKAIDRLKATVLTLPEPRNLKAESVTKDRLRAFHITEDEIKLLVLDGYLGEPDEDGGSYPLTKKTQALVGWKDKEVLLGKVAKRYYAIFKKAPGGHVSLMMDLQSVDEEFNMDWKALLEADDANAGHDLSGIVKHMVRDEFPGKLGNCFVPRFAKGSKKESAENERDAG